MITGDAATHKTRYCFSNDIFSGFVFSILALKSDYVRFLRKLHYRITKPVVPSSL
jgi:hypothetical protein